MYCSERSCQRSQHMGAGQEAQPGNAEVSVDGIKVSRWLLQHEDVRIHVATSQPAACRPISASNWQLYCRLHVVRSPHLKLVSLTCPPIPCLLYTSGGVLCCCGCRQLLSRCLLPARSSKLRERREKQTLTQADQVRAYTDQLSTANGPAAAMTPRVQSSQSQLQALGIRRRQ